MQFVLIFDINNLDLFEFTLLWVTPSCFQQVNCFNISFWRTITKYSYKIGFFKFHLQ